MDFTPSASLAQFYRKHLLQDVMPFWEARTKDDECGGYLTCFDRKGTLTDSGKYIWFQGRQLYMFSALYNQVEKNPKWLDLARQGRDFIVGQAYAGNGRWQYRLDRAGRLKQGAISIHTDNFVLQGLCEYAVASGGDQDRRRIVETFDAIERHSRDLDFKDIFHSAWNPRYQRHAISLSGLWTAGVAGGVLGRERTRPLIDYCLEQILHVFAKDDRRLLFESVGRDGSIIDEPEGRLINPGHGLESAWFCIEEGRQRGDRSLIDRAIQIAEWSYAAGHDRENGGIFSFLDANGEEPLQTDWHRETKVFWHDKVWWVHCEALYALALAGAAGGGEEFLARFIDLHHWCQLRWTPLIGQGIG